MPRRRKGVLHCLVRRETGCPLEGDRGLLLAHVEDITASSCTKEERCDLPGTPRSTFLVCFSPDRSKMASTHGDHSIRIVDSYTGKCLRTLLGHPRTPWCIAFHPSANDLVASGCLGGEVRIWDLMGGCEVYTPPDRAVIASLAFHPIDKILLIATSNKLFFWQWNQQQPFACLNTNFLEEKVRLVKFSPFGDYILTGITNVTQTENGNGTRNSNQAPINQLLQSVSCTQLDSDQVSQYILRPSATHTSQSQDTGQRQSGGSLSSTPDQSEGRSISPASQSRDTGASLPDSSDSSMSSLSEATSISSASQLGSRSVPSASQSQDSSISYGNQSGDTAISFPSRTEDMISPPVTRSQGTSTSSTFSQSQGSQIIRTSGGSNQREPQQGTVNQSRTIQQSAAEHPNSMHRNLQQVLTSHSDNQTQSQSSTIQQNDQQSDGISNQQVTLSSQRTGTFSSQHSIRSCASLRPRNTRDYRGVFAIFRARDGGSWNLDTSDVDGEPTDVGSTSLVFNQTDATDSMSFGQVDNTGGSSNTSGIPTLGINSGVESDPVESQVLTSSTTVPMSRPPTSRNVSLSSVTTSSELVPQAEALSSNSDEEIADNNSDSILDSRVLGYSSDSTVYDIPMRSEHQANTDEQDVGRFTSIRTSSSETGAVDQDIPDNSHTAADWNSPSSRHDNASSAVSSDVTISMDTVGLEQALNEEDPSYNPNGDRLISGVGSVFNVGSVSSRTSYVSHGSNYSSSLSTLSNQEGSGTAIATATARTFRHVHTAVVVANGTNGGPQVALRTAINRAIAGAFAGSGEGAVASNIINTTHRLQWWDFSKLKMPDLQNANTNVVVPCCKIHNDASCDISADGTILATFVPSAFGFPDDGMLGIYSLRGDTLGQCLFTKKFGPNAISVSLSSLNRYVVVGLAARRIHWHLTSRQMMAQIFKITSEKSEDAADKPVELPPAVCNIVLCEGENERRSHVSVNAAFWHPVVGCGLVYGTNRGDLRLVHRRSPKSQKSEEKAATAMQGVQV